MWIPDTCKCALEYHSGGNDPKDFKEVIVFCEEHKGITDPQILHDIVLAENQNKNKALKAIAENHPEYSKTDLEGNVFADLSKVAWNFDADRNLSFILQGADDAKKAEVQSSIDAQIGSGKAVIA